MNYWFLTKCFLVGIAAISPVGPIFLLTFNNGALRGFFRGFATAIGAALGDSLLFFLGLMGMLSIIQNTKQYIFVIDLAGGILLLAFGFSMIFSKKAYQMENTTTHGSLISSCIQAFFTTVLNPITMLFFIFMATQIVPENNSLPTRMLLLGSGMAFIGSTITLGLVAIVSSTIGSTIGLRKLKFVSFLTGLAILGIGSYFLFDAALMIWHLYVA